MILFRTHYNIDNQIIRIKKLPECSPTIIRLKEVKSLRGNLSSKLNQESLLMNEFAKIDSITYNDEEGMYFPSEISERLAYFESTNSDNILYFIVPYKGIIFYIENRDYANRVGGIAAFIGEAPDKSEVLVINSNIGSVKNLIAKSYRKTIPTGVKPKIFIVNLDNYCKPKLKANVILDNTTFNANIKSKLSTEITDFSAINRYIAGLYHSAPDCISYNASNSVRMAIFGLYGEPIPNNYLINATEKHNVQATQ